MDHNNDLFSLAVGLGAASHQRLVSCAAFCALETRLSERTITINAESHCRFVSTGSLSNCVLPFCDAASGNGTVDIGELAKCSFYHTQNYTMRKITTESRKRFRFPCYTVVFWPSSAFVRCVSLCVRVSVRFIPFHSTTAHALAHHRRNLKYQLHLNIFRCHRNHIFRHFVFVQLALNRNAHNRHHEKKKENSIFDIPKWEKLLHCHRHIYLCPFTPEKKGERQNSKIAKRINDQIYGRFRANRHKTPNMHNIHIPYIESFSSRFHGMPHPFAAEKA